MIFVYMLCVCGCGVICFREVMEGSLVHFDRTGLLFDEGS